MRMVVGMMACVLSLAGGSVVGQESVAVKPPASQAASRPALQLKGGEQIVAMGDSITQAGGYLRVIDAVLAQHYAALKIPKVVNVGISGQKAEDMVKRFDQDVVRRKPAIVTISVGINDVWHRVKKPHDAEVLETYKSNVGRMVAMAQEAGARVLIVSPTVIEEDPVSEGNQRLKMYIAAGKEIANERHCDYVDLHELFLRAIANRRRSQASQPEGEPPAKGTLTTDGVHMRPMGDTLMAIGILRTLGVPDETIIATDLSGVFK